MPVRVAAEPPAFHHEVRVPGLRSVYEKCGLEVPEAYARRSGPRFSRVMVPDAGAVDGGGRRAVAAPDELPGGAFEPYWTAAISWLMDAYHRVCAFCCFRIHASGSPSADHMVPKSKAWDRVYEWSNYRLATLRMNSLKQHHSDVIDPFEVQDGWFALELIFGQIIPGPVAANDPVLAQRVHETIDRLRLNDLALERLRDIEAYQDGDVSFSRLREESPFVAAELRRQGRLRPEDQP